MTKCLVLGMNSLPWSRPYSLRKWLVSPIIFTPLLYQWACLIWQVACKDPWSFFSPRRLSSTYWYYESWQAESFQVNSSLISSLCPATTVHCVSSKRALPSSSAEQPRAMARTCIFWEGPGVSVTNSPQGGVPYRHSEFDLLTLASEASLTNSGSLRPNSFFVYQLHSLKLAYIFVSLSCHQFLLLSVPVSSPFLRPLAPNSPPSLLLYHVFYFSLTPLRLLPLLLSWVSPF